MPAIREAKQKNYREFIDFLSTSTTTSQPLNHQALEKLIARTTILGSPETSKIAEQIKTAFQKNDRQAIKPLLKNLAAQIKLEL